MISCAAFYPLINGFIIVAGVAGFIIVAKRRMFPLTHTLSSKQARCYQSSGVNFLCRAVVLYFVS